MDEHTVNDWAETQPQPTAAPTTNASQAPRKTSRAAILGVAAACLLSGGIGYGVAAVSHGNDFPGGFAEFDGRHPGPGGQLPPNGQPNGGQRLDGQQKGQLAPGSPGRFDPDGDHARGFDPRGDDQPQPRSLAPNADPTSNS